jgi:hypothetical protein
MNTTMRTTIMSTTSMTQPMVLSTSGSSRRR